MGYQRILTRDGNIIEISTHAIKRAIKKKIEPHMIEATIMGGRMKKFGRNRVKFIKEYKPRYDPTKNKVICVDEPIGHRRILIKTIVWA